jgi:multisubunit Na+/H+ antiporter MnhF subunit
MGEEASMGTILTYTLYLALVVHIGLLAVVLWKVWRGDNIIAALVLLALIERNSIYIDVALGLAALGFIGIIALAKYVADEQMF